MWRLQSCLQRAFLVSAEHLDCTLSNINKVFKPDPVVPRKYKVTGRRSCPHELSPKVMDVLVMFILTCFTRWYFTMAKMHPTLWHLHTPTPLSPPSCPGMRSGAFNRAVDGPFAPFVPLRACPHLTVTSPPNPRARWLLTYTSPHPRWGSRRDGTLSQQTGSSTKEVPRYREASGPCS